ncbi:hypothetical protein M422DRAFT_27637 [Sphaerobolus stellatus SS14]|nr:hypothetical protein M422DRAFT_27637 [Sphaerobolus stellatus SS14]
MPFVVFWSTKLVGVSQLRQLGARSLEPVRFSLNLPSSTHVLITGTRIAALHLGNFTAEFQSKPSFLLAKFRKAENASLKSRAISSIMHGQGTLFSFKPSVEVVLVITLPAHSCGVCASFESQLLS